jgi:hypothetical protein
MPDVTQVLIVGLDPGLCFNTHPGDTAEAVRRWI